MKLSYCKLNEAVRINGSMTYEVHDATASALGVVVPSTGGAVLIPWHAVRWAVEAERDDAVFAAERHTTSEGGLLIEEAVFGAVDSVKPAADKPKRKRAPKP